MGFSAPPQVLWLNDCAPLVASADGFVAEARSSAAYPRHRRAVRHVRDAPTCGSAQRSLSLGPAWDHPRAASILLISSSRRTISWWVADGGEPAIWLRPMNDSVPPGSSTARPTSASDSNP